MSMSTLIPVVMVFLFGLLLGAAACWIAIYRSVAWCLQSAEGCHKLLRDYPPEMLANVSDAVDGLLNEHDKSNKPQRKVVPYELGSIQPGPEAYTIGVLPKLPSPYSYTDPDSNERVELDDERWSPNKYLVSSYCNMPAFTYFDPDTGRYVEPSDPAWNLPRFREVIGK